MPLNKQITSLYGFVDDRGRDFPQTLEIVMQFDYVLFPNLQIIGSRILSRLELTES